MARYRHEGASLGNISKIKGKDQSDPLCLPKLFLHKMTKMSSILRASMEGKYYGIVNHWQQGLTKPTISTQDTPTQDSKDKQSA